VDKAVRIGPPLVVFLDRDGVICRYYARDLTVVISNQSGVNKGIYSAKKLKEIDCGMKRAVNASGGRIDAAFYCPHTPDESCLCRKPGTGLVKKAVFELNLNPEKSIAYFVGDSETDIITGHRAGLITILVLSGQTVLAKETDDWKIKPEHIAPDLMGALKYIL